MMDETRYGQSHGQRLAEIVDFAARLARIWQLAQDGDETIHVKDQSSRGASTPRVV